MDRLKAKLIKSGTLRPADDRDHNDDSRFGVLSSPIFWIWTYTCIVAFITWAITKHFC
jgi:hypothetical protein